MVYPIFAIIAITLVMLYAYFLLEEVKKGAERTDLFRLMALTLSHYILLFPVFALLYMGVGRFNNRNVLLTVLAAVAALLALRIARTVKHCGSAKVVLRQMTALIKRSLRLFPLIPILVCILITPFTIRNAELLGMGQDEGVYQTEAISYAQGDHNTQHDFVEYATLQEMVEEMPAVISQELTSGTIEDETILAALERLDAKAGTEEGSAQITEMILRSYRLMVNKALTGFYHYASGENGLERLTMEKNLSDVSGYYHGVHVYSAMMGLWGRLFGIRNMMGMQTFIFYLVIFVFYYIVRDAAARAGYQPSRRNSVFVFIMTALLAFSPLVLWTSKTAYSELPLTLAMTLYLYYILRVTAGLDKVDALKAGGADLSKAAHTGAEPAAYLGLTMATAYFAAIHITYLVYYPINVLVYMILIYMKKRRGIRRIWPEIASLLCVGGCLMVFSTIFARIATQYYYGNIKRLYRLPLMSHDTWLYWIAGGILLSVAIVLIFAFLWKGASEPAGKSDAEDKAPAKRRLSPATLVVVGKAFTILGLFWAIRHAWRIGFLSAENLTRKGGILQHQLVYAEHKWDAFLYMAITALALATGFLLLAILAVWLFTPAKRLAERLGRSAAFPVLAAFFVYMIPINLGFFKNEVFYYFYYSRYFDYLVPIALLTWVVLSPVEKQGDPRKSKWLPRNLWALVAAVALLVTQPIDTEIRWYRDDTHLPFDVLYDFTELIEPGSAVIITSEELQREFAIPLKNIAQCDVYPLFDQLSFAEPELSPGTILALQEELLAHRYSSVYILTDTQDPVVTDNYTDRDDHVIGRENYKHAVIRLNWHIYQVGPFYPDVIPNERPRNTSLYQYER